MTVAVRSRHVDFDELKRELNALRGLTPQQIDAFGGTTEQLDAIIAEVNKAAEQNLKQAALIDNIKNLGQSTYELQCSAIGSQNRFVH